jgi:hypothetical protein
VKTHLKFHGRGSTRYKLPLKAREQKDEICVFLRARESARMIEDTPESHLASLQRKFRLLSEGRQATVISIYASRYRSEVFNGRRVGAAFESCANRKRMFKIGRSDMRRRLLPTYVASVT